MDLKWNQLADKSGPLLRETANVCLVNSGAVFGSASKRETIVKDIL